MFRHATVTVFALFSYLQKIYSFFLCKLNPKFTVYSLISKNVGLFKLCLLLMQVTGIAYLLCIFIFLLCFLLQASVAFRSSSTSVLDNFSGSSSFYINAATSTTKVYNGCMTVICSSFLTYIKTIFLIKKHSRDAYI